ncbi:MAG TPA: hypothetical protein VFF04_02360, partial [Candidatus Babeliales bacterium]|nr:hypothetical protein [Candidatus Babeliales bacterium]
ICQSENIAFDQEGLSLIIEQAQGSARDALNVLEQVRFSHAKVSRDAVLRVLGHLDDESLLTLIELAVSKKPADLLAWLHEVSFESYSAEFIWHRLAELVRAIIWMKHGVQPKQFTLYASSLQRIAKRCSWALLNELLDMLYSNEIVFNKTTAKHALLEMLLLQLCQKYTKDENESGTPLSSHSATAEQTQDYVEDDEIDSDEDLEDENDEEQDDGAHAWNQFLKSVEKLNDPLLNSVFRQGKLVQFDSEKSLLEVQFSKEFSFFKDWLNDTEQQWMPLLKNVYSQSVSFHPLFTGTPLTQNDKKVSEPIIQQSVQSASQSPVQKNDTGFKKEVATSRFYKQMNKPVKSREPIIAISDATSWPKASMMLSYFPGTITEIKELGHER